MKIAVGPPATKRESGSTAMHGRAQYDPYGNNISTGAWSGSGVGQPYGYTGARWDSLAGLYLMGARWYAPEMGRFVELDPIGEGGGWNLYNYVGSSPTMWVDPSGLKWQGVGPPGHIQNPKYASSSTYSGGGSPGEVSPGIVDGLDLIFNPTPKGPRSPIPCYVCNNADETGDSGAADEETSDEQESGATEEPGIGITPAEGADPRTVDQFEKQVEKAIGMPITKGEDGRYRRGQGPVTEKKQAALDAFDNAARMGTNIKTASRTPDGKVDDFDSQTVYVDTLAGFPTDEEVKDTHAITQEENVVHILAEYTEGTRRGAFKKSTFDGDDGAHALGVDAQNAYRKANGRVEITGAESTPHGVFNRIWYGTGMRYRFSYADGTSADFHVWTGGTALPPGWR